MLVAVYSCKVYERSGGSETEGRVERADVGGRRGLDIMELLQLERNVRGTLMRMLNYHFGCEESQ